MASDRRSNRQQGVMVTARATSFSNAYVLTVAKAWLSASAGHLTAVAVVAQTIGGAEKDGLSLWTLRSPSWAQRVVITWTQATR
jgi:hypothetical protein